MFVLLVELEARPESVDALEAVLRTLVGLADQEAGTVFYALHRPPEQSNTFVLYEMYQDRAAWQTHCDSEPVARELQKFESLLALPAKISFLDPLQMTAFG